MKAILLVGTLLGAVPVFAQTDTTTTKGAGTIAALDQKNGFRGYVFGTPMTEYPGLKSKRGSQLYSDPSEHLSVGNAKIKMLYFIPREGKLAGVTFSAFGEENVRQLLSTLQRLYGQGEQLSKTTMEWKGAAVTMQYQMRATYPTYTSRYAPIRPSYSCEVYIMSNAALSDIERIKQGAAQQAAGDL